MCRHFSSWCPRHYPRRASLARPVDELGDGENQEERAAALQHRLLGDSRREELAADDGDARAQRVAEDASYRHSPYVLVGGHRDRRDLRAITPLGDEGQRERLQRRRRKMW